MYFTQPPLMYRQGRTAKAMPSPVTYYAVITIKSIMKAVRPSANAFGN